MRGKFIIGREGGYREEGLGTRLIGPTVQQFLHWALAFYATKKSINYIAIYSNQ